MKNNRIFIVVCSLMVCGWMMTSSIAYAFPGPLIKVPTSPLRPSSKIAPVQTPKPVALPKKISFADIQKFSMRQEADFQAFVNQLNGLKILPASKIFKLAKERGNLEIFVADTVSGATTLLGVEDYERMFGKDSASKLRAMRERYAFASLGESSLRLQESLRKVYADFGGKNPKGFDFEWPQDVPSTHELLYDSAYADFRDYFNVGTIIDLKTTPMGKIADLREKKLLRMFELAAQYKKDGLPEQLARYGLGLDFYAVHQAYPGEDIYIVNSVTKNFMSLDDFITRGFPIDFK